MKHLLVIHIILLCLVNIGKSQTRQVPFTLDDRDRIMRTEERMEALRKEMNSRFEAQDAKFAAQDARFEALNQKMEAMNSRIDTLYWGFGILIALMIFMLGYIIYDRRTAFHPLLHKNQELDEKYRKLEQIMKEKAKEDSGLEDILRSAGLL